MKILVLSNEKMSTINFDKIEKVILERSTSRNTNKLSLTVGDIVWGPIPKNSAVKAYLNISAALVDDTNLDGLVIIIDGSGDAIIIDAADWKLCFNDILNKFSQSSGDIK